MKVPQSELDMEPSLSQETFSDLWKLLPENNILYLAVGECWCPQKTLRSFQNASDSPVTCAPNEASRLPNQPPPGLCDPLSLVKRPTQAAMASFEGSCCGTAKSINYMYSPALNKLFSQLAKTCAMQLWVSSPPLLAPMTEHSQAQKIRAPSEVARCCSDPVLSSDDDGLAPPQRLIRLEGSVRSNDAKSCLRSTLTVLASTATLWVMAPAWGGRDPAAHHCHRHTGRPHGNLLGWNSFEVYICAFAGRGWHTDDENFPRKRDKWARPTSTGPSAQQKKMPLDGEHLTLQIRGCEHFQMLRKLNGVVEMKDAQAGKEPGEAGLAAATWSLSMGILLPHETRIKTEGPD
ncbi:Cellular tumor antigen p53 [Galemys pyrenaicus]|uniref:Cellular tumor antigen p53 n=1 Tax=Galemys pyrenaicus TaxID=202257 RepID=A0A8J6AJ61_GALPY|nr:Cellular tumor antigen p53 [Galemys pyrenaicus]